MDDATSKLDGLSGQGMSQKLFMWAIGTAIDETWLKTTL